jgi:two-component system, OmpR family, response regulator
MNAGPRILIVDDQPNIRDLLTTSLRFAGYTAPILFLTAKDDTEDKIIGLTVSGDDYVTRPFSLDEIVARIKAILRRTM